MTDALLDDRRWGLGSCDILCLKKNSETREGTANGLCSETRDAPTEKQIELEMGLNELVKIHLNVAKRCQLPESATKGKETSILSSDVSVVCLCAHVACDVFSSCLGTAELCLILQILLREGL